MFLLIESRGEIDPSRPAAENLRDLCFRPDGTLFRDFRPISTPAMDFHAIDEDGKIVTGVAAVSAAPSCEAMRRSWARSGYLAGSNALPGLPQ